MCILVWQVGIPVLGVVENMSGLRQAASEVAFKQADGSGGEVDVTARVLQILREQLGDQVGSCKGKPRIRLQGVMPGLPKYHIE